MEVQYASEIALQYLNDLLKFEDLVALNDPNINDNLKKFKTRRAY